MKKNNNNRFLYSSLKSQTADLNSLQSANDGMRRQLQMLQFEPIMDAINVIEKNRLFGTLDVVDSNQIRVANIKVRNGIIEQVYLQKNIIDSHNYKPHKPLFLIWQISLRNNRVIWKQPKEAKDA